MTEVNEVKISGGGGMAEEGGGGGMGKIIKIVIIVVVALMVIGGGVIGVLMLFGGNGDEEVAGDASQATGGGGTATIENPVYLSMGTFIVNLADGRRYLKTNLELMLSEEKAKVYLETRLAEVKDIIVSELQALNTEQLRDPRERSNLKQRLLSSIESLLPNKDLDWDDPVPIKKVLITEFYLQ